MIFGLGFRCHFLKLESCIQGAMNSSNSEFWGFWTLVCVVMVCRTQAHSDFGWLTCGGPHEPIDSFLTIRMQGLKIFSSKAGVFFGMCFEFEDGRTLECRVVLWSMVNMV